jgi:hypothetical protein
MDGLSPRELSRDGGGEGHNLQLMFSTGGVYRLVFVKPQLLCDLDSD